MMKTRHTGATTPFGGICQYNQSNDGRGKFRASLARIYAEGMSAHANRNVRTVANKYLTGTKKHFAFQMGWEAGVELESQLRQNRAKDKAE